ncbi:MAG: hypothetical protein HY864_14225 [Chloroflexi bacterium]|nr:hypothetical protein [Chloroflexota bacterium]
MSNLKITPCLLNKLSFPVLSRLQKLFFVLIALGIGCIVRYPYIISRDIFPLGDGGLFIEMIYSIKANGYLLPRIINFNSHDIPFAYPPLGFYLALAMSRLSGLTILHTAKLLPILLNLLTIVFFVLLASELTRDKIELLIASTIFPVVFQVYQWTIKGGGLSRSPGFLFMIVTLYWFLLYKKGGKKYYFVFTIFSLSVTLMSHLEWALIAAASLIICIFSFRSPGWKRNTYDLFFLGIGSVLVSMPWWGTVVYRFGLSPFISAWNIAGMNIVQFVGKFLAGGVFSINVLPAENYFFPLLGVIGVLLAVYRRDYFVPLWLLSSYAAAPKNSPISGVAPLIILIAMGLRDLDRVAAFLFSKIMTGLRNVWRPVVGILSIPPSIIYLAAIMTLALPRLIDRPMLRTIKPIERTAMEYVANNTPANAKFIVLTPNEWYSADAAEWFPYLSDRQSVTTPQGLEWVSAFNFNETVNHVAALARMVREEQAGVKSGQVVEYVEDRFLSRYEYVAIFANSLEKEFGGFLDTGRYEIFYYKKDVLILKLLSAPN